MTIKSLKIKKMKTKILVVEKSYERGQFLNLDEEISLMFSGNAYEISRSSKMKNQASLFLKYQEEVLQVGTSRFRNQKILSWI